MPMKVLESWKQSAENKQAFYSEPKMPKTRIKCKVCVQT